MAIRMGPPDVRKSASCPTACARACSDADSATALHPLPCSPGPGATHRGAISTTPIWPTDLAPNPRAARCPDRRVRAGRPERRGRLAEPDPHRALPAVLAGDNGRMPKKSARRRAAPRTSPSPAVDPASPCPCGLAAPYRECCGSLHTGRTTAATAERLMRSRYAAFVVHDAAYLLRSWHPSTRPSGISFEPAQRWTGLQILHTTGGTAFHAEGTVEFEAHFTVGGHGHSQHEVSRFVREDGHWVYLNAVAES